MLGYLKSVKEVTSLSNSVARGDRTTPLSNHWAGSFSSVVQRLRKSCLIQKKCRHFSELCESLTFSVRRGEIEIKKFRVVFVAAYSSLSFLVN